MSGILTSRPDLSNEAISLLNWATEASIPVQLSQSRPSQALSATLDKLLSGKSTVYLGEPDHFIQEKYAYQQFFIDYLSKHGWTHIGKELGQSDGARINNYIQTGDASWLKKVALYGYRVSDRNDCPQGRMYPLTSAGLDGYIAAEHDFIEHLRQINISKPIEFFGYDIDICPGGAYEDLSSMVQDKIELPQIQNILQNLARVPNESAHKEVERLTKLMQLVKQQQQELKVILGAQLLDEFLQSLYCLRDSLQFVCDCFFEPSIDDLWSGFARREQVMFRQITHRFEKLSPNSKTILLGHNVHLSKDSNSIEFFNLCGSLKPMWPSIGTFINNKWQNQTLSIWMLFAKGTHSGPYVLPSEQRVLPDKESIENLLAEIGNCFLLPIALAPQEIKDHLSKSLQFGCNGEPAKGALARQADCIFFVDTVNAL